MNGESAISFTDVNRIVTLHSRIFGLKIGQGF